MTEHDIDWIAITEQIEDWRTDDCEVSLAERVISQVLLSGGTSKNGHRYTEAALREAAALYDRKPVFLDHAANIAKPFERSTRDLAGWIAEAAFVDGRIIGQIRVLDTEAGRTLLALMSAEGPSVGMSHVILARRNADGTLVERIHDVISVDAVVFPATTAGFREQLSETQAAEAARLELEAALTDVRGELQLVIVERNQLRLRCEQYAAEACDREIDRQLAAAGISADVVTASLRNQLRAASDAHARSRLIAEHRQLVLHCRQRAPCSRARTPPDDRRDTRVMQQIVQAVKGNKS